MSISKAYSNWSTTYDSDRNLTRDLDGVVTRQAIGGNRYDSILELGCGTGKNTVLLAEIGKRVFSLDFSEGMIAQARTKVTANNVQFAIADLTRAWPCADHEIDLIVCNLVLEHIENLDAIFAEAQRVLVAGGHFFICELHPFKQYQGKKATFQQGDEQIDVAAFVHHISDFVNAAQNAGFRLTKMDEWWHDADADKPPRVVTFMFEK